jgi:hypothetical protein
MGGMYPPRSVKPSYSFLALSQPVSTDIISAVGSSYRPEEGIKRLALSLLGVVCAPTVGLLYRSYPHPIRDGLIRHCYMILNYKYLQE